MPTCFELINSHPQTASRRKIFLNRASSMAVALPRCLAPDLPEGVYPMPSMYLEIRLVAKFSGHFRISDISDFNGILNFLERYLGSGGVPLDSSWSWDSF